MPSAFLLLGKDEAQTEELPKSPPTHTHLQGLSLGPTPGGRISPIKGSPPEQMSWSKVLSFFKDQDSADLTEEAARGEV